MPHAEARRRRVAIILAEISDKMPTLRMMWLGMVLLATPFLCIGLWNIWTSLFSLAVAIGFGCWMSYWSYQEAYLDSSIANAVQSELGPVWTANSIASSFLPAAIMVIAFLLQNRDRFSSHRTLCPSASA